MRRLRAQTATPSIPTPDRPPQGLQTRPRPSKNAIWLTGEQWKKLGYWGVANDGGWLIAGKPELMERARGLSDSEEP